MPRRRPLLVLPAAALLALVATATVQAFNPQPDPPKLFGMVGLARGQTLRVSAVNVTGEPSAWPPGPCRVRLGVLDGEGQALLPAVQVMLKAGEATALDLPFDRLPASDLNRVQVRPFVLAAHDRGLPPDPCRVTVEVFDDETGRTALVLQALPAVQRNR